RNTARGTAQKASAVAQKPPGIRASRSSQPCSGVFQLRCITPGTLDPLAQNSSAFFHYHLSVFRTLAGCPSAGGGGEGARNSRLDQHNSKSSARSPPNFYDIRRVLAGAISLPALPPFPYNMSTRRTRNVPATPRVISPSPTPSDVDGSGQDASSSYNGPVTRSAARRRQTPARQPDLP